MVTLGLLVALPRVLVESSHADLVPLPLFAGLVFLVVTAASARWILEFSRATVSEDGTRLIIDNPHPNFAHTAVLMGAERNRLPDR